MYVQTLHIDLEIILLEIMSLASVVAWGELVNIYRIISLYFSLSCLQILRIIWVIRKL